MGSMGGCEPSPHWKKFFGKFRRKFGKNCSNFVRHRAADRRDSCKETVTSLQCGGTVTIYSHKKQGRFVTHPYCWKSGRSRQVARSVHFFDWIVKEISCHQRQRMRDQSRYCALFVVSFQSMLRFQRSPGATAAELCWTDLP